MWSTQVQLFLTFCSPCILVYLSQYLTNLMHKICFTISFISCLYMFRAICAHHQEVKIALHSLLYHHTETSEWSKITKIQFYKYEQIVLKFMYEFFRCDYCVLFTVNVQCHVRRSYVCTAIKLIRKVLCLFTFMFAQSIQS